MSLTPQSLLVTLCDVFEVDRAALMGRTRTVDLNDARQCYYWIAMRYTRWSYRKAADMFNRTHGSALAGARAAQKLLETSKPYRELVNTVLHRCGLPPYVR